MSLKQIHVDCNVMIIPKSFEHFVFFGSEKLKCAFSDRKRLKGQLSLAGEQVPLSINLNATGKVKNDIILNFKSFYKQFKRLCLDICFFYLTKNKLITLAIT